MAGVPTAMTSLHDLQTIFFNIMTSQRDNTMRIRRRATLEYVKRIDATRYIAPCICHTIRHIHGNDVLPLREVWYLFITPSQLYMFRAMFSPIIRSTWHYLQHLVIFTNAVSRMSWNCVPIYTWHRWQRHWWILPEAVNRVKCSW